MTAFTFNAIGTSWQIDLYETLPQEREERLLVLIKTRVEVFEQTYSRFRPDSLVATIARQQGTYTLPPDAEDLLALYYELYKRTEGFFTPFMGRALSDAGYDTTYSLQQQRELSAPPQWEDVFEYKHPTLIVREPVALDFGAAGKGYLIDIVGALLEAEGIYAYCIDAGGDILYKNNEPLRVGLENPRNTEEVLGVYMLNSGSICGSAGNRRAWKNFTHIINPKTLVSPTEILAVWVVAETAFLADALTTCLFFLPAKALADTYTFEYAIVRSDFSIETSVGFNGELFTS